MSFTELKQTIRQLTPKQRREVTKLLAEIAGEKEGQNWPAELARRHAEMDAGQYHTLGDLKRRHTALNAQGR